MSRLVPQPGAPPAHAQSPAELREYLVAPARWVFRPRGLYPGQLEALLVTLLAATITVIVTAVSGHWAAALEALVIFAALVACVMSPWYRWTEIERRGDDWRITTGVWKARGRTRDLLASDIGPAILPDARRYEIATSHEHLTLAFASKPFQQAPPAIDLLDAYLMPRSQLEALCELFADRT